MIASGHPPSPRLRFGPRRRYGADLLSCSCELPPVGPREFGVGKLLPNDLVRQLAEPLAVVGFAGVEPERRLIEIAEDVERLDGHVRAVQCTLHQGPEVLKSVRVDAALHVDGDVVHNIVHVVLGCVDAVAGESDTTNNCSGSVAIVVSASAPQPPSDLTVGSPSVNDNSSPTEGAFTLSATVRNAAGGAASATTLRHHRSLDATIRTADTQVGTDAV